MGLCKAVVLHHKQSLEELVIGGRASYIPGVDNSLDPLVPALLTCLKLTVLKLGPGKLSRTSTLTVLEKLPNLQELVLRGVSIRESWRQVDLLDEVCLNATVYYSCVV